MLQQLRCYATIGAMNDNAFSPKSSSDEISAGTDYGTDNDFRAWQLALRVLTMPADTNQYGDIFGGWLLSQADVAGATIAIARARGRVATVAVSEFHFLSPVRVGDLVELHARLLCSRQPKVGRTVSKKSSRRSATSCAPSCWRHSAGSRRATPGDRDRLRRRGRRQGRGGQPAQRVARHPRRADLRLLGDQRRGARAPALLALLAHPAAARRDLILFGGWYLAPSSTAFRGCATTPRWMPS
jgi:hypothetical protein